MIGISLSKSGDFSDPGHAAQLGYQLWADTVNKQGGILGRKVQLKIVDDASSPSQVVTNYQTLISRDKVDLVFGPFSTLLTAPAARVAERYGYAFPEPSGGGPLVFQQKLGNVFFCAARPDRQLRRSVRQLHQVPAAPASGRRPPPTPTSTTRSPQPIAAHAQAAFQAMGIKTVYSQVYPAGDV